MKESVIQAMSALTLLCFSVLVGMVGIGFLIAGLYLTLTHWLMPAAAAAATGGLILLVTLLLLLVCKAIASPSRRLPPPEPHQDELSSLFQNAASMQRLTRQMESSVREHKPLFTAGSFAVGFFLGVNPEARRALGTALKEATAQLKEAEGRDRPAGRP